MNRTAYITIEGVEYPLCQNLKAFNVYEERTGKRYTEIDLGSCRDITALLYGMAVGGSMRAGKEFPLSFSEFEVMNGVEELQAWLRAQAEGIDDAKPKRKDSKKKS